MYFGRQNKDVLDIDRLFGSAKFELSSNLELLHHSAVQMLTDQIDVATFDQKQFLKKSTDIIAIDRQLSQKMKARWLGSSNKS